MLMMPDEVASGGALPCAVHAKMRRNAMLTGG